MEKQERLNYSIKKCSNFDELFFEEFISIRTSAFCNNPEFFSESLDDFSKLYSLDSPFFKLLKWEAIIVKKDSQSIARILYTMHETANNDFVNCGYIESPNDVEICNILFEQAEKFAKANNKKILKGPIQGTFFNAYRCKRTGESPLYYSEPVHHNYLPDLFLKCGFNETGKWDTTSLDLAKNWENFKQIRKTIPRKNKKSQKIKIRGISFLNWNRDLKIIYDLFMQSFENMPEFEPISFDCFKFLYGDLKYIINPLVAYIFEHKGRPVAFSINFFDPLPILIKIKKLEKKFDNQVWKLLVKIYALIRLKVNFNKLLLMYIGKIPLENGEEPKGIQALAYKRFFIFWKLFGVKEVLACYTSVSSLSRKSFKDENQKRYASYSIFSKNIDHL